MRRDWTKPQYRKDLELIAQGDRPDWMKPRQQPAVVKTKDELRREAEQATEQFKASHQITVVPGDPTKSPSHRREPWNPFK